MIKQLWFIRNERKLINALCFTIVSVVLLYSLLSIWALASSQLEHYDAVALKPTLAELMGAQMDLLILPLFSLVICSILFFLSNHTKPIRHCIDAQAATHQKQFRRDMLIGNNLMITFILTFFQLDRISVAKDIAGFGLLPIYICIAGGILFYFFMLRKLLSEKDEVS